MLFLDAYWLTYQGSIENCTNYSQKLNRFVPIHKSRWFLDSDTCTVNQELPNTATVFS